MQNAKYILMYEDTPAIMFNPETQQSRVISPAAVPFQIKRGGGYEGSFSAIRHFCSQRVMLLDRTYCKEILTSAGIDNQDPVEISIVSKGLSFRDNYWIKKAGSNETWANVNLYENPFHVSVELSKTALTGDPSSVEIGDKMYTGELSGHGTRAKCFFRQDDAVFLAKAESPTEIANEIASHTIASLMKIRSVPYIKATVYDRECSVCRIATSPSLEMIHAADVLSHFSETRSSYDSKAYDYFMSVDALSFVKMQLFDYLTLNTDRNRDNYALAKRPFSQPHGLFPMYDHDSCFKGRSDGAAYFVTKLSFKDTVAMLNDTSPKAFKIACEDALPLYKTATKRPSLFENAGLSQHHIDGMVSRLESVFSLCKNMELHAEEKDLDDIKKDVGED